MKQMKITELAERLNEKIAALSHGDLDLSEIENVYSDAQNLYERVIILRAKAYSGKEIDVVEKSNVSTPIPLKKENVDPIETKIESVPKQEEFSMPTLDFSAIKEVPKEEKKDRVVPQEPIAEKEVAPEIKEPKPDPQIFPFTQSTPTENTNKGLSKEEIMASINDHYKNAEDSSLLASIKKAPIQNLKTAIGINDRFAFIKDLFENETTIYDQSIERLNNMSDADEAKAMLSILAVEHDWDLESKTVISFVELIERRYSENK